MANTAEKLLETSSYNGEQKRWDFERYITVQLKQHLTMHGLEEHGYKGIDERSKVRHLLNGIKTTSLDTVKAQIMLSAALRNDFNACVTLFKDFIVQTKSTMP